MGSGSLLNYCPHFWIYIGAGYLTRICYTRSSNKSRTHP